LLPAAGALGLVACSLGPRYTRPDIPAPPAWRAVPPAATNQSGAVNQLPAAWPSADWWKGFNSPRLDELMTQARSANDDLGAAIARVREADAQARIAGAALLPSVALDASATRQKTRTTGLAGVGGATGAASSTSVSGSPPFNLFITELSASYQIDFWGKNRATRDAARMAAAASRFDAQVVELTVMTSVATTYFQALEFRDRVQVAENNLASAQTTLDGLRLELQVGTVNALDVAQQETVVATLQAAVPPLQQALLQTMDALAILIGKEPEAVDVAAGTLLDLSEPQVRPGLPSELLARRPDVASAEAQLIEANANVAAARAAFFPSINLTAAGGFASTALNTLISPGSRIFALTGSLSQPIFQGGALSGQYAFNKARYAELAANYHKAVISAFSNTEDALAALRETADQLQREQEAVAKARRAYELSQTQFHAGTINILTVLSTETALFTAEDALVQVKFSHLGALIALYSALGGGWQRA
jgi:NodT family efflux transporter outer membrane factor (OMF) lipoprotein